MKSNLFLASLALTQIGLTMATAAPVVKKCAVAAKEGSRLDALIAAKIAQRPKSKDVEVPGFEQRFRISESELKDMEKQADTQVSKMVELALDASRPNALSEAAVEQALAGISSVGDPTLTAFVAENALLKAKQAARIARQVKKVDSRSVQDLAQAGELSAVAVAMISLDQLMKVLQENGGKVGLKVRAGQFLTSLPKVGHLFEGPVDSYVTLADRVNEIIKALDGAMLQISTNTNTLKDARDRGDRLLDGLAREVTLLGMMVSKLQYAANKVKEVDETASRRLEAQGLARVSSLMEGRQSLMVGIHVGNQVIQQEITLNGLMIQQTDITKLTTVPITAQSLTVRANQELNAQYAKRIEGIRAQTQTQLLAMNQGLKEAAAKAVQLAQQKTLDPETLLQIQNTVAEVKAFVEQGFIDSANQKINDIRRMQEAFQRGQGALALDGRTTVEEAAIRQLTNDASQVLTDLEASIRQVEQVPVRK